jgi:hypothetical protein
MRAISSNSDESAVQEHVAVLPWPLPLPLPLPMHRAGSTGFNHGMCLLPCLVGWSSCSISFCLLS